MTARIQRASCVDLCTTACQAKAILLAVTSPPGLQNMIISENDVSSTSRRTCYVLRGQVVCYQVFSRITCAHHNTLYNLIQSVISDDEFVSYFTKRRMKRHGVLSAHSIVENEFFSRYMEKHALQCPRGRGVPEEAPLILLPSDTTISSVSYDYEQEWSDIAKSAFDHAIIYKELETKLRRIQFRRIRVKNCYYS